MGEGVKQRRGEVVEGEGVKQKRGEVVEGEEVKRKRGEVGEGEGVKRKRDEVGEGGEEEGGAKKMKVTEKDEKQSTKGEEKRRGV